MQLDSTQNPKVRKMVRYRDRPSLRRNDLVVLVEGVREIERAAAAGWKLRQTFWEPGTTTLPPWAINLGQHFRCAAAVYENRHYDVAGLCRTPLEASLNSELRARQVINKARRG